MTASSPTLQALQLGQSPEVAIRLDGVSKAYKIYDQPFSFLKEALTGRPYHRDKVVLSDISLTLRKGEIIGIIGRNGAGKSTLLKLIAGTLSPTQGDIEVSGRIAAILELGTGFNENYSGRDNVILSALMRGMSEEAVRRKFDSIVAFAGLEDVIDEPFHTYSSGMQARLAFAAATAVEADVIVIDEALSTGDIRFASRSLRRIHEICQSGVTALFVSHSTYYVMQLCTRAIWIDDGRIRMDGPPLEVVRAYEYEMHEAIARDDSRLVTLATGNAEKNTKLPAAEADASAQTTDGATPIDVSAPAGAPAPTDSSTPIDVPALADASSSIMATEGSAISESTEVSTDSCSVDAAFNPVEKPIASSALPVEGIQESAAAALVEPGPLNAGNPAASVEAEVMTRRESETAALSEAIDHPVSMPSANTETDEALKKGSASEISTDRSLSQNGDHAASEERAKNQHFSTGQYRIGQILFLDKNGRSTNIFRFGEQMRMKVSYECLMSELPEYSCGLAVAFNRVSDFESVMYYNTSYPHSDEELQHYFDTPFRKYIGRTGQLEAVINPLQLRAGEYYVSLGILPNQPGPHEFYEYIRCHCRISVLASGFDEPSVFYPIVQWTNGPVK